MSVTLCVANDLWAKEMSDRLKASAGKKGINSAKQLFDACKAAGIDAKMAFCRNIWYGVNPPVTTNVAPILELLELNFDQYVFGRPPRKLSVTELKMMVGEMIEDAGGEIPQRDPEMMEIERLLMKVKSQDQKAAVVRMLKAYIGDS